MRRAARKRSLCRARPGPLRRRIEKGVPAPIFNLFDRPRRVPGRPIPYEAGIWSSRTTTRFSACRATPRRRDPARLSQAGAQIPSGRQQGKRRGNAHARRQRSLRRAGQPGEAAGLRQPGRRRGARRRIPAAARLGPGLRVPLRARWRGRPAVQRFLLVAVRRPGAPPRRAAGFPRARRRPPRRHRGRSRRRAARRHARHQPAFHAARRARPAAGAHAHAERAHPGRRARGPVHPPGRAGHARLRRRRERRPVPGGALRRIRATAPRAAIST